MHDSEWKVWTTIEEGKYVVCVKSGSKLSKVVMPWVTDAKNLEGKLAVYARLSDEPKEAYI